MSSPKWITSAGNLGIVPALEYYQLGLDAYDPAGGTLTYSRVSGRLPPGIQLVQASGTLQGIPISELGPDTNASYTFTIRVTNTSTNRISDRTFSLTITNVAPPVIVPKNTAFNTQLELSGRITANIGDYITQSVTSANARVIAGVTNNPSIIVSYVASSPKFRLGSGNLGIVSANVIAYSSVSDVGIYPTATSSISSVSSRDLGAFLDGDIIDIQLEAIEFILENNLSWALKEGELPTGLSLSTSGLISGYIEPIPPLDPNDPRTLSEWDAAPFDLLGFEFYEGATKKTFTFTIEVTDGVNYDVCTYTMLVYPRNSLSADTSLITADTNQLRNNLTPKHFPIILSKQSDLVTERQGSYFSFQIQALDLDGDVLEYNMPAISTGAFDEHENDILAYVKQIVSDGNLYVGTTSVITPNKPALVDGDDLQVLYTNPSTGLVSWYNANVTNYTTVRLTGNTIVTGNVNEYLTQAISGANITISNISPTTGTIVFGGNLVYANVGDFITQGNANAQVTSTSYYELYARVTYLTDAFVTGSGNISINGNPVDSYPISVVCKTDVGGSYNNANTVTLNSSTSTAIPNIAGVSTNSIISNIVSVGVTVGSAVDQTSAPAAVGFDGGKFDQGVLILPLTFVTGQTSVIDTDSGWITGYIPGQVQNETQYEFEITVSKRDYPQYSSSQIFTLTVLGDLDNTVTWLTPGNLGSIQNGKVSDLFVRAISSKGRTLKYAFTQGEYARLPQGLRLESSGLITGRVSFEVFTLDQGLTTLDSAATTFDDTYEFSVTASDLDNSRSATRIFTISITERNTKPYENLYLKAMLTKEQRQQFLDIMQDQTVFPIDLIYRHEDPNYGVARDLRALFLAGLNPSTLSDYANAVSENHYSKRITVGSVKTAIARGGGFDVVDIATDSIIGTYQDNIGFIPTNFDLGYTSANTIPSGSRLGNEHILYEVVYVDILDNGANSVGQGPIDSIDLSSRITNLYYDSSNNSYSVAYPNAFTNMEKDVVTTIGYANKGALPDWMSTIQEDGSVLGFKRAVVLAYTKPGAAKSIAWRFEQKAHNLNELDFTVDRYQLDNTLSANYDTTSNAFVTSEETTFDRYPPAGALFTPSGTVDYAVRLPYEVINQRSIASIVAAGGLDGISNFKDGETLVFAQQEFRTSNDISDTYNQGWSDVLTLWAKNADVTDNDSSAPQDDDTPGLEWDSDAWDASGYVPGYNENVLDPTIENKRSGIWRINVAPSNTSSSDDSIVTLTFVETVDFYNSLYVRRGFSYGRTNVFYDPIVKRGNILPNYTLLPQQIDIISTRFDGNSTRFLSDRDEYTVPQAGDKYIKFAKTGVFT